IVRLLRTAPGASRELASALVGLASARPEDDALLAEAGRVLERVRDWDASAALCRARLARALPPPRVRIALVRALRRGGKAEEAVLETAGLESACTPWAYAVTWITAVAAGEASTAARALGAIATTCAPRFAAVVLAAA